MGIDSYEDRLIEAQRQEVRSDLLDTLAWLVRIERGGIAVKLMTDSVASLLQAIEQELPYVLRRIDGED